MVVKSKDFSKVVGGSKSNNPAVNKVIGKPFIGTTAFKDYDRDGFVNVIDCAPRNPKRHGWFGDTVSKVKSYASEKYGEWKAERERKRTSEEAVKRRFESGEFRTEKDIEERYAPGSEGRLQAKKLLYSAREKEREQELVQKAREKAQEARIKERHGPRKTSKRSGGNYLAGIGGPTGIGRDTFLDTSEIFGDSRQIKLKRKRKKSKSNGSKSKAIYIRLGDSGSKKQSKPRKQRSSKQSDKGNKYNIFNVPI